MATLVKGLEKRQSPKDDIIYAEGKNMAGIMRHLCTMARPGPYMESNPDVCRKCDVQCNFGKRFVELWDAGERPTSKYKPRKKKPQAMPREAETEAERWIQPLTEPQRRRRSSACASL